MECSLDLLLLGSRIEYHSKRCVWRHRWGWPLSKCYHILRRDLNLPQEPASWIPSPHSLNTKNLTSHCVLWALFRLCTYWPLCCAANGVQKGKSRGSDCCASPGFLWRTGNRKHEPLENVFLPSGLFRRKDCCQFCCRQERYFPRWNRMLFLN